MSEAQKPSKKAFANIPASKEFAGEAHLAQFNYARLRHPIMDDRSAGFRAGSGILRRVVERAPGFVWAWDGGIGGVPTPPVWGDPLISVNMSVWQGPDPLRHFVYNTLHKRWLTRRGNWFVPVAEPFFVLWWVAPGHRPTLDEGLDRLLRLARDGAGPEVFAWEALT